MYTDANSRVACDADEIFQALYSGKIKNINHVLCIDSDVVHKYEKYAQELGDQSRLQLYIPDDLNQNQFDNQQQQKFFMPLEYQTIDIEKWLLNKCKTQQQIDRVTEELIMFKKLNMIMILKYLLYLVDTMRKNNIVWGVGRGSSVASYCLFLIGIHKIDSIYYSLDISEFLTLGDKNE
jgi:DNA polymerase III alpha subunit